MKYLQKKQLKKQKDQQKDKKTTTATMGPGLKMTSQKHNTAQSVINLAPREPDYM